MAILGLFKDNRVSLVDSQTNVLMVDISESRLSESVSLFRRTSKGLRLLTCSVIQ